MNAKTCFLLAALAFSCAAPPAAAQVNLVVNGGFDTGISGWTTNASSGYYESLKGNPGGCFTLLSSISQSVTGLVPGSRYIVSGSYDIEGGNIVSTPSFGVAIDGAFLYEVAPADYAWHDFAFSYTATSSTAVLGLAAQINGTSDVYRVDNVAIQPAPSVTLRVVGTNVVVSWPTNMPGLTLQSATNLNAPTWVTVTNTRAIVGTNYSVALSRVRQVQFFCLTR
jgi:endoglucanase